MNPTYRPQKPKIGVASAPTGDEDPYFQSIYSPTTSSRKQTQTTSNSENEKMKMNEETEDMYFNDLGNTYHKLLESGVDDTFPEDVLDHSPWSREMVRRARVFKENQNQKDKVLGASAGISENLKKLSVRDQKEDGKRKPLGEVNRKETLDKKNSHPIQPTIPQKTSNQKLTPKKKNENSTPLKSSSSKTSLQVAKSISTGEPNKKEDLVLTESASDLKSPSPALTIQEARLLLTDNSFSSFPPPRHLIKQIEFWRHGDDLLSQHESLMDIKILGQPIGTYENLIGNPYELRKRRDLYVKLYNWMITPESIKQEIIGLDLYGGNDKPEFRVSIGKCNDWNYFEQQTILTEMFSQSPDPSEEVIEKISKHVQLPLKCVEAFLDNYQSIRKKNM